MTINIPDSNRFTRRRAQKLGSDPVSRECECNQGWVILFYKYLDPAQTTVTPDEVYQEAVWQETQGTALGLSGKVRVAQEGLNVTVAGTEAAILAYIDAISRRPWLQDEHLADDNDSVNSSQLPQPPFANAVVQRRYLFFKPSPGCVHVFDGLSIKIVHEICPLGYPDVTVKNTSWPQPPVDGNSQVPTHAIPVGKLAPDAFHIQLKSALEISRPTLGQFTNAPAGQVDSLDHITPDQSVVLLDARNYYESRIGHFQSAICPPIRKFSSLPEYLQRHRDKLRGKTVLTYCTGGIRCEKLSSYIRDKLYADDAMPHETGIKQVWMLEGGIHNYMEWIKHSDLLSPAVSRADPPLLALSPDPKSFFIGRNYVFDARQSLALPASCAQANPRPALSGRFVAVSKHDASDWV
ncbi:hypothetical protein H4R34_002524 [Dimargaris verticillata]|uniref:Rhodanese domain-containing protein n=1 Tax=Dimargaris verticillata TaxID=2761393 RepID=A0A9W8E975_9FUNG|nr:hypothetical protein H4R34_002524 [Dimargaris verticillata]